MDEAWFRVYLGEPSARVASELEEALETGFGEPLVGRLIRCALEGGEHGEAAARRLLCDPRRSVRLCAVRALGRIRSEGAFVALREVVSAPGDGEIRLAAAAELTRAREEGGGSW